MLFVPDIFQTLIVGLMILIPVCAIYAKAGFNPLWAVLVFIPGGIFILLIQLAFRNWPNQINLTSRFQSWKWF